MSEKPISRFPVPELNNLPEDIREKILTVQEKSGFVPNVFLALANRPDEFRAFFAYHDALMEKEGGLSKGEREMIVVATSAHNQCIYCVVAHGAILRIREKIHSLLTRSPPITSRQTLPQDRKQCLTSHSKFRNNSHELVKADFDNMRELGFSNDDIWDIGAISGLFALSNRMANLTSMRPNDEFYLLGRIPKEKP